MIKSCLATLVLGAALVGCGSSDGDIPKDMSPQHPLGTAPGRIQGMGDAQKIADQAQKKATPR